MFILQVAACILLPIEDIDLLTKNVFWRKVKEYLLVAFAGMLNAISLYCFVNPSNLVAGGFSGLSTVLSRLICVAMDGQIVAETFDKLQSIMYFALNVPLLIVSLIFLRGDFTFKTIWATVVCTLTLSVLSDIAPDCKFHESPLIAVLFGGIIIGMSMHIAAENNGSNAGTEVIAKLVAKYRPEIGLSTVVLISNLVITVIGSIVTIAIVEDATIVIILYSLTYVILGGASMGMFNRGFDHPQKFMIVTREYDKISQEILTRFKRGLTLLEVDDDPDKKVIMVIVQFRQAVQLKQIIKKYDPSAFTFVKDVYDIFSRPSFNRSYKTK